MHATINQFYTKGQHAEKQFRSVVDLATLRA